MNRDAKKAGARYFARCLIDESLKAFAVPFLVQLATSV